jgi:molecular chaperone HtpG
VDFSLVPLLDQAASPLAEPKSGEVDDATLIAAVKDALGERVFDVRASQRLTDSPACLVASGGGFDRELSRLLARQNRGAGAKPILELNMRHALVRALAHAKAGARDDDVADLSALLFEQAKILDGEVPDDPAAFAARLNRLVVRGLPFSESDRDAEVRSAAGGAGKPADPKDLLASAPLDGVDHRRERDLGRETEL